MHTLLHIYQSLIPPYLSYGISVWGQAYKSYLKTVLILQKRVLRFMYFTQKNEYTIPLFINAKILLMHDVSTASAQLTYVIYLQKRLKQKSTILISNDVSLTLMIMHHFQILKVKFL